MAFGLKSKFSEMAFDARSIFSRAYLRRYGFGFAYHISQLNKATSRAQFFHYKFCQMPCHISGTAAFLGSFPLNAATHGEYRRTDRTILRPVRPQSAVGPPTVHSPPGFNKFVCVYLDFAPVLRRFRDRLYACFFMTHACDYAMERSSETVPVEVNCHLRFGITSKKAFRVMVDIHFNGFDYAVCNCKPIGEKFGSFICGIPN